MIAKFNSTGTHIHKGFLKVRIDLYPKSTDKTCPIHYVDEVDEEGKPTGFKQLNPCLCHFLIVDPSISLVEIAQKVRGVFDSQTILNLDDALSKFDIGRVQQIMSPKCGMASKVVSVDIAQINSKLASLEVRV